MAILSRIGDAFHLESVKGLLAAQTVADQATDVLLAQAQKLGSEELEQLVAGIRPSSGPPPPGGDARA